MRLFVATKCGMIASTKTTSLKHLQHLHMFSEVSLHISHYASSDRSLHSAYYLAISLHAPFATRRAIYRYMFSGLRYMFERTSKHWSELSLHVLHMSSLAYVLHMVLVFTYNHLCSKRLFWTLARFRCNGAIAGAAARSHCSS